MNIKGLMAGLAVAVVTVSNTQAADDIQIDDSRFDWSGIYWGVQAGWARADYSSSEDPLTNYNGFPSTASGSFDGWLAGVHIGMRQQTGNFVFGVEGDVGWMDVSGTSSSHNAFDTFGEVGDGIYATGRLVAGFATDSILFYGTGGVAVFDTDIGVFDTNPIGATINAVNDKTLTGLAAGGGIEIKTGTDWSWKIEYLHMDFGDVTVRGVSGFTVLPETWTDSLSVDTVTIKLSKPI